MCPTKEPEFFYPDNPGQSTEDYLASFAGRGGEKVVGEASTRYAFQSSIVAKRIAAFNETAKILITIREPLSFLYSFHTQITRDPDSFLELYYDKLRSPERYSCSYAELIRYKETILNYQRCFGEENVAVEIFDDLKADYAAYFERLFNFLGVAQIENLKRPESQVVANRSRRKRKGALASAILAVSQVPPARAFFRLIQHFETGKRASTALRKRVKYQEKRRPPLPKDEARRLRESFEPCVAELSSFLDRDLLTDWGYRA